MKIKRKAKYVCEVDYGKIQSAHPLTTAKALMTPLEKLQARVGGEISCKVLYLNVRDRQRIFYENKIFICYDDDYMLNDNTLASFEETVKWCKRYTVLKNFK